MDNDILAGRIRPLLSKRNGYSERNMFGGVCFMINGNMCVGTWKDSLIVRLEREKARRNAGRTAHETCRHRGTDHEGMGTGGTAGHRVRARPEGLGGPCRGLRRIPPAQVKVRAPADCKAEQRLIASFYGVQLQVWVPLHCSLGHSDCLRGVQLQVWVPSDCNLRGVQLQGLMKIPALQAQRSVLQSRVPDRLGHEVDHAFSHLQVSGHA